MRDFCFSVDRGGTFTDVFAEIMDGKGASTYRVMKLLSVDPQHYQDAPREGIRRILEEVTGLPYPIDHPLDTSRIVSIRMGTTVATNALLERKGERTALLVTKGFPDLLYIANQSRPNIFDLQIQMPDNLYERVVEVDELVTLPLGDEAGQRNGTKHALNSKLYPSKGPVFTGTTGEQVCVRKAPDLAALKIELQKVLDAGIKSVAVVLKHSAIFSDHEHAVGRLAKEMGFTQISLSSVVMPMVKMVPRGFTAAADAYLTPHIMKYLNTFQAGFDVGLKDVQLLFMQSDGGLAPVERFSGHRAILSGPAGGYVGYALTTKWDGSVDEHGEGPQVIGFDMGGTSTDVSRFAGGTYEHVFETTVAGVTIQAPQLDINTVAAGGGSRLFFRSGVFVVGPESTSAYPGPVCYKKGGMLAITDANLALGRIMPEFFPKIFGPNDDEALHAEGTQTAFEALTVEVNEFEKAQGKPPKSVDEVAMGFVKVANETMCRPIRALTQMKGYDAASHVLACFGGAGGQHACAIARSLGMTTIFVHRYAAILSAVGIHLADIVQEGQEPCAAALTAGSEVDVAVMADLNQRLDKLEASAKDKLRAQGFLDTSITVERFLNLRYEGTDVAVMTTCADAQSGSSGNTYQAAFEAMYQREFGFKLERPIVVDDVRVRVVGCSKPLPDDQAKPSDAGTLPQPCVVSSAYFEGTGRVPTPAYMLADLLPGHKVAGPAVLIDKISTVVVEPGCVAHITAELNIRIAVGETPGSDVAANKVAKASEVCDPIQLAIFSHRFMGIAEQMGRTLQRTSISVNIKERLDFSCALFGPDGSLVANAPHLPVHLGAMSEAVRFQVRYYSPGGSGAAEGLAEGDVLMSNHPQLAGGSHLPDITVITPVFNAGKIVFFVASRGHHADIGGISPGSMPPKSTILEEEGAAIISFKLVRGNVFQEAGVTALLNAPGLLVHKIPEISGTRNLSDNLSDLKAQVAANTKGIQLVGELIQEYGLNVVQAYMGHIQKNAELSVREMLQQFSLKKGLPEVGTVYAQDIMDDGTPICLSVTIDRRDGSAIFDFAGTGPEVYGNCNAPPAVAYSAIIYSLRCMVTSDIPLNQGCLAPITVNIPPGCLLNPSETAAVVGGNVLTSQRVTDVVLKAFEAAAASQGCMNNLTFGDEQMGYYETIAGGAGAGPGWHGRSGVHTHMTNTRITDPEILERRYPVVLHRFQLRAGSGGDGQWRGGDGVIREIEALRPISAGILSERRAVRPFGLQGGAPGTCGQNLLVIKGSSEGPSQRTVNLGAKATVVMQAGDRLQIFSPGAGGFGPAGAESGGEEGPELKRRRVLREAEQRLIGSVADYSMRQHSA